MWFHSVKRIMIFTSEKQILAYFLSQNISNVTLQISPRFFSSPPPKSFSQYTCPYTINLFCFCASFEITKTYPENRIICWIENKCSVQYLPYVHVYQLYRSLNFGDLIRVTQYVYRWCAPVTTWGPPVFFFFFLRLWIKVVPLVDSLRLARSS